MILLIGIAAFLIWKFFFTKSTLSETSEPDPEVSAIQENFTCYSSLFNGQPIVDEASALTAIEELSDNIGIKNVSEELTSSSTNSVSGNTYYRFQQTSQGLPVYGRSLVIAADSAGSGLTLTGNYASVEKIDLTPTLSTEEINNFIIDYIKETINPTNIESFSFHYYDEEDLCIYYSDETKDSHLAYVINAAVIADNSQHFEIVVDANSGDVYSCTNTLWTNTTTGYAASDTEHQNGFNIFQTDDENYIIYDEERQISLRTFNYTTSQGLVSVYFSDLPQILTSSDIYFGNTELENTWDYEKGAHTMANLTKIYDYFKNTFSYQAPYPVRVYYNDAYCNGENALGGTADFGGDMYGLVSMGYTFSADAIDIMAHEYTHYVTATTIKWNGGKETGALCEAFSDIFGEIIESKVTDNEINWHHGSRNIEDPDANTFTYCIYESQDKECPFFTKNGNHQHNTDYSIEKNTCLLMIPYPITYLDDSWYLTSDGHQLSLVVSHAAYQMWSGIENSSPEYEALSTDQLAELFYSTILTMPSDCTMEEFATLITNNAKIMQAQNKLTPKQYACVEEALLGAGLSPIEMITYQVTASPVLSVYDVHGNLYDNYTVTDTIVSDDSSNGETKTYTVLAPEKITLELGSGYHIITITDNAPDANVYTYYVNVVSQKGVSELSVYTTYGISKLLVSDAYSYTGTINSYELDHHIPQINLDFAAIQELNSNIYGQLYPDISDPAHSSWTHVTYDWAQNGNVLSLWIELYDEISFYHSYFVYNIDITTGESISNESLVQRYGWSQTEYQKKAREALGSRYLDNFFSHLEEGTVPSDYFYEQFNKTVSDDNINRIRPYLDSNGHLCIVGAVYSLAAADYYENLIDLELYISNEHYQECLTASVQPVVPDTTTQTNDTTGSQELTDEILTGNWYSTDEKYVFHFGNYSNPGDFSDAYYVTFRFDENVSCNVEYTASGSVSVTPFNGYQAFEFQYQNGQLVSENCVLNKVPNEYTSRLVGTWSNGSYTYEFKENGKYNVSGDYSDWGFYYVISDSQIVMSKKSESFDVHSYSYNGNELTIDNKTVSR